MTGSIIISTNLQILAKDSRFHQRKSRVQVQAPKKDSANTNVSCKQSECKETGRSGKNACACTCIVLYTYIYIYIYDAYLPVVPHKAVAEVSKIGNLRRGWLL